MSQCAYINRKGEQCKTHPWNGAELCGVHRQRRGQSHSPCTRCGAFTRSKWGRCKPCKHSQQRAINRERRQGEEMAAYIDEVINLF